VFFDDGYALAYGVGSPEQPLGSMVLNLGKVVRCAWQGDFGADTEGLFFGSDDGFVYRMERGSSFDGEPIEAWLNLAFSPQKSPSVRKRYRRAYLDLEIVITASLRVGYDLSYADPDVRPGSTSTFNDIGGGGYWDGADWEEFVWDAATVSQANISLAGVGRNIALLFYANTDEDYPFTLQNVLLHYTPQRYER
jgi:hypothetical protein